MKILLFALSAAALALSACQIGGGSYIGVYEVKCPGQSRPAVRAEMRSIATSVANGLGVVFDETNEDQESLNLILREIDDKNGHERPGLVFSFVNVTGDQFGITIAKDGPQEDGAIQRFRSQIETVLKRTDNVTWRFSVSHWTMAK
jgi:hypothetical protein